MMKVGSSRSNDHNSDSSSVYRALRNQITTLKFSSFQILAVLWLGAKGFRNICSFGRHSARGRRRIGGADYTAQLPHSENGRVAIGLRHWRTPVGRRVIDELRGFMLRNRISSGLLVTSGTFSHKAVQAALELPGRPISLVSGSQLAGSLVGIGIGADTQGVERVDQKFFRSIDSLRLGVKPNSKQILDRVDFGRASNSPEDPDSGSSLILWAALGLIVAIWTFWELAKRMAIR